MRDIPLQPPESHPLFAFCSAFRPYGLLQRAVMTNVRSLHTPSDMLDQAGDLSGLSFPAPRGIFI